MNIHGLKLELEQLRYHESQVNVQIDAPLTSSSHNFLFDHQIFEFHTFLETRSQDHSTGVKINPIQDHSKVVPPRNLCQGHKRTQAPPNQKKGDFPRSCSLLGHFIHISPLFQTHFYTQKHSQNKSKPLDSSLHQKYKVLSLYLIFFSLVLHLGFGVWGCGCSFLATIHSPNFLNLFLTFILPFLPNNMIYCFIQHDSCFILLLAMLFSLFPQASIFFHVLLPLLHVLCFMPYFRCLDLFFPMY